MIRCLVLPTFSSSEENIFLDLKTTSTWYCFCVVRHARKTGLPVIIWYTKFPSIKLCDKKNDNIMRQGWFQSVQYGGGQKRFPPQRENCVNQTILSMQKKCHPPYFAVWNRLPTFDLVLQTIPKQNSSHFLSFQQNGLKRLKRKSWEIDILTEKGSD